MRVLLFIAFIYALSEVRLVNHYQAHCQMTVSVRTLVSIQTDGRGEDLLPSKHTATSTYADMLEAVNVCSQSKDQKCYIIRWNEVKQFLVSKDKTYEQYSVQQLRYKYKYLKKAKKLLK